MNKIHDMADLKLRQVRDIFLEKQQPPVIISSFERRQAPLESDDEDNGLDLRSLWITIKRHKITILLVFLLVFILNAFHTYSITPVYRASMTLELQPEEMSVLAFDVETSSRTDTGRFYETQYRLLQSRNLAERVIKNMGLESEFQASLQKEKLAKPFYADKLDEIKQFLKGLLNQVFPIEQTKEDVNTKTQAESSSILNKENNDRSPVSSRFLASLSIAPVKNSQLVTINYDDPNPQLAAAIVNGLAETYINMSMERRVNSTRYAEKFLQEQLIQVKSRLEKSEAELVAYAREKDIVNTVDDQDLSVKRLSDLHTALTDAEKKRILAESLNHQSRSGDRAAFLAENLGFPAMQALKEEKAKLEADYQEKQQTYRPEYPPMKELKIRIETLAQQITNAKSVARDGIEAQYLAAKQEEDALRNELKQQKNLTLDIREKTIRYNTLQREIEISRNLYESLLQRLKEVNVAGVSNTNTVSVVDSALVPSHPYKPEIRSKLLSGALLGLFIGIAIVFLREFLDERIKSFSELEHSLNLPLLGTLPATRSKQNYALLTLEEPRSAVAEASRSLCANLMFSTRTGTPRIMNITSTSPSEGKTSIIINIATAFAKSGKKVLIIDADLRKPKIHKYFKLPNEKGLSHYLVAQESLRNVIQKTPVKDLYVITNGGFPPPNPVELLHSQNLIKLAAFAKSTACPFDMILIDSPPVIGLADALIISHCTQATLMVVAAKQTQRSSLQIAYKRLNQAQSNIIGIVMNNVKANAHDSDYYNYDYYHSNYSDDNLLENS